MDLRKVTLVAVLLAAACSDGSDGTTPPPAPTPTPTPAPSPTPTPTPTPTPIPTGYPKFDELAGNHTFLSACAWLDTGMFAPFEGQLTISPWSNALTVVQMADATPSRATTSYSVKGYGTDRTLPPSLVSYDAPRPAPEGMVLKTTGKTYVRFVDFYYQCIIGFPTRADDRPAGTVLTYPAVTQDLKGRFGHTVASNVTMSVDLVAQRVTIRFDVFEGATSVGSVTGDAAIDPATGAFEGAWAGIATGRFAGNFFGPQWQEPAFAYYMTSNWTDPDGRAVFRPADVIAFHR